MVCCKYCVALRVVIFESVEFQRERERDFLPCHPFVLRDLFNFHTKKKNPKMFSLMDTYWYVYVIKGDQAACTVYCPVRVDMYGCMDVWMYG